MAAQKHSVKVKKTLHATKTPAKTAAVHAHPHPTIAASAHRKKAVVLKAHHRKPYRKRHFGYLGLSIAFAVLLALQTGILLGNNYAKSSAPIVTTKTPEVKSSVTVIRSSYGYSLAVDANIFNVSATFIDGKGSASTATPEQLHSNEQLSSVIIKPQPGTLRGFDAAARVDVEVNPSTNAFENQKSKTENSGKSDEEVAGQLFAINSTSELDASVLSSKADSLNGVPVQRTVYQLTPRTKGSPVYAVVWSGVTGGKAFAVKLQGLVGSSRIPAPFETIFQSLNIVSDKKVLGAFTDILTPKASAAAVLKLDPEYISNAYSPAVVRVYRIMCGVITTDGKQVIGNIKLCGGGTGSGFFVSSDGYIATNGHVAVYDVKDLIIETISQLSESPNGLIAFLRALGYSDAEIKFIFTDPAGPASLFADIYDSPADRFGLDQKDDVTLVTLGTKKIDFSKVQSIEEAAKLLVDSNHDTKDIKTAKLLSFNYNPKDLLGGGFSASDVALLKVDIKNAPVIRVSRTQATQNEKLVVLGFPGNADNSLTDNGNENVSATDGVVSAIRTAAGGKGTLYQTDASISHGNSGGPALGDDGAAIGLSTYGISGDTQGNEKKNYIRDIRDFTKLTDAKNVTLDGASSTQALWEKGLNLYNKNHFSAAIKNFDKVIEAYPAHRLANTYIATAKENIAAGKDVKDFPIVILIIGVVVALVGVGVAVFVILRHRGHHQLYQAHEQAMPAGGPGPQGYVVPPTPQQGMPMAVAPVAVAAPQPLAQTFTQQPMNPPVEQVQPIAPVPPVVPMPSLPPAPVAQVAPPAPVYEPQNSEQPTLIVPTNNQNNQPPLV